jgi:hypothetical protein
MLPPVSLQGRLDRLDDRGNVTASGGERRVRDLAELPGSLLRVDLRDQAPAFDPDGAQAPEHGLEP